MGLEAVCTVRSGNAVSAGKALLETDEILFRGEFRLRIPLCEISHVVVQGDELCVASSAGTVHLALGASTAGKWADRIKNPRTLLDKLGVKPGMRLGAVGSISAEISVEVEQRNEKLAEVHTGETARFDLVFLQVESLEDLAALPGLEAAIVRSGGIWIVAPKGQSHVREADILQAGREAGLVDVKVARVSPTHTGHKFVIPVNRR